MQKYEASIAIQVLPNVNGDEEVIRVVDEVIAFIKSKGLSTFVSPFETVIEGDLDTLMSIATQCQKICIKAGADGVFSNMKISYNPQKGVLSIDKKVKKHHQ